MANNVTLRPVAVYHCDFPDKFGLPRQSGLASALAGRVVFEDAFSNPDFVRGIEGYSRLWLLWHCHLSGASDAATVRPPKLGGNTRVGVFASRSPFRPNPIALSCVEFCGVETQANGRLCLLVRGGDLADGTPVFDVKPYLPYADAFPDESSGFAKTEGALRVQCADALLTVVPQEKQKALLQSLSLDPRPGYQSDPTRVYKMRYAACDVSFFVDGDTLVVTAIDRVEAP